MSFNRAAAFRVALGLMCPIAVSIALAGCGGGGVATTPIAQPTATPVVSVTSRTGIAVPVAGGVVALPPAGGMAESFTFRPGNPAGLFLNNVQAFSFGQTGFGSAATAANKRSSQDVGGVTSAVCQAITAVAFTVSVETPLSQLGQYSFSPLAQYEAGFGNGTFSLQLLESNYPAFLVLNLGLAMQLDPQDCATILTLQLFGLSNAPVGLLTQDLAGTGVFSNGSLVSFPFTAAQVGATTLKPGLEYLLFAKFAAGSGSSASPNPIPTAAPTASPTSTPTASPSPSPTPTAAPSAAGTLSISPGTANFFLGNPPAALGSFAPSIMYNGTIAGIASPMSAPYLEVLGSSPHACPVTGTVIYSLEVTYPLPFAFVTTGNGYMSTIITPGTADGTAYHAGLFRAGGCNVLEGPDNIAVSGGALTFAGAGVEIVVGNETDVVEFWH
jgi:hypothetical protein